KAAGFFYVVLVVLFAVPRGSAGQVSRPDSLELQQPENVFVIPVMNANRQWFSNYIFWEGPPDSMGTFIHQPDTLGWNAPTSTTVQESLSVPMTSGGHIGDIDRTIGFRALRNGRVGVGGTDTTGVVTIRYEIITQEFFNKTLDVGASYQPGEPIPLIFVSELDGDTLDLGINLHFGPGLIDSNGVLTLGVEDFEGFHMWRGINEDGSNLTVLGELSKEEAFRGGPLDQLYFGAIIDSLRSSGYYNQFGVEIDITYIHPNGVLGPNEFVWVDDNAFNGFTYQYLVTTFDRDYNVKSHSQGLFKFDNCPVTEGEPIPCPDELVPVSTNVTPQNDMMQVYTVPNPYRSGSSQYTTPGYHNFPDDKV
ncbi:MAG: hypothetical protein KAJ37_10055, partial [Candidatus Krumholzibacteria bacterium]|nr:hypothetical protein [Candidatus Krumholzibacteria bacterium]